MRNFIIGLIVGFVLAVAVGGYALSTDIGSAPLWNRVFDSTTNTISIIGQ